jgi:hypothetical protein
MTKEKLIISEDYLPGEYMPSLKDLKALVKAHVKDAPKMSAGKEALLLFAEKKGLLKAEATPAPAPASSASALPEVLKAPKKKATPAPKATSEQGTPLAPKVKSPKVKATAPVADVKPVAEPKAKKSSPFAQFMSANKGSGKSMAELSEMYRNSKLQ